jgi:hypothetical protein
MEIYFQSANISTDSIHVAQFFPWNSFFDFIKSER